MKWNGFHPIICEYDPFPCFNIFRVFILKVILFTYFKWKKVFMNKIASKYVYTCLMRYAVMQWVSGQCLNEK